MTATDTTNWPADLLAREFRDKRVLVTGSSRGIGAAVAAAFAQLGARVAIHGRDPAVVDAVAASMGAGMGNGVVGLAGQGLIHVETQEFPLEDALDVYQRLREGRIKGRAVLRP